MDILSFPDVVDIRSDTYDVNILLAENFKFSPDEIYKYKIINSFFRKLEKEKINKMLLIVSRKHDKISLRMCDWFATNYSITTNLRIPSNKSIFNVHSSYKAQLSTYKKKYFDPFRRNKSNAKNSKFYYIFDKSNTSLRLLTTIAQLNFFKWMFDNNILEYIEDNYDAILSANRRPNIVKKKNSTHKQPIIINTSNENSILYI